MINQAKLKRSQIKFSWHFFGRGVYLVAYDMRSQELVEPFINYVIYLTDKESLDVKTVKNEASLLKSFFEFLPPSFPLQKVDDNLLCEYRDQELCKTIDARNSRGDKLTAKRTVNQKLRRIYLFLVWCQETGLTPPHSIGPYNCNVTASYCGPNYSKSINKQSSSYQKNNLPILFRRAGERSANRPKYFATVEDKAKLYEYFKNNFTEFVFARNVLIMEIADSTGWRRGSITSLRCELFILNGDELYNKGSLAIQPASQKFSYQNKFDVSFDMVVKVNSFISTYRKSFLDEMNWTESRAQDRVFISARDGKPLSNQSVSAIFGKAFKAIGCPSGAGIHSFRRKFANEKVGNELKARIRLGLDTSAASVAASVALELGHSNPNSVIHYVNRSQSRMLTDKDF